MKVIATTRTLNEEKNVGRFIESYDWVDEVLIVDGGSEDNTVSIVNDYNYAYVRTFHERVEMDNGYWRNPQGKHINTCIDWAIEREADWIIFDDCDCFPNALLKEQGRDILLDSPADVIFIVRLYLWGKDKHFPKLAKPTGEWCPSIWAWRADTKIRASEKDPLIHDLSVREKPDLPQLQLLPPYCLLHYYCPDEETTERKLKKYRESGQHPTLLHPLEAGGELESLPEWAKL